MPLPPEILQELELKRAAERELAERDAFWARVRTALACVAWSALGLVCMGYGLHTTDPDVGRLAFNGGVIVGYAGVMFTLLHAYHKARERGDL